MLVLSRKTHQRIRLGDAIVVTVVGVGGDRVKLGIEAPTDIRVLRDELKDASDPPGERPTSLAPIQSTAVA